MVKFNRIKMGLTLIKGNGVYFLIIVAIEPNLSCTSFDEKKKERKRLGF